MKVISKKQKRNLIISNKRPKLQLGAPFYVFPSCQCLTCEDCIFGLSG